VIHINGSIDEVPDALFAQLAEGGRLVCILGQKPGVATLYMKEDGEIIRKSLFDAIVPELEEMTKVAGFSF
jgi:protein-L-isoaspartate(D-aspartate) O-methyltransferase